MSMVCARCGRSIKYPVYFGGSALGSVCARAVGGMKPSTRVRLFDRKPRPRSSNQGDLFATELAHANKVDALLSTISLEMP